MPRTRARKGTKGTGGAAGVFDLGAHRMAARFDVPIVDPDGTPTPMVVTLCSRYSREFRERRLAAERATLERASGEAAPATDPAAASVEASVVEFFLDLVVSVTVAWRGFVLDGVPMDCTPENVRAIYTSDGLGWLYRQVEDAYLARERFFVRPGSAS